jgi:hypothetical protein
MVLLGDVGERQEVSERPGDRQSTLDRKVPEGALEGIEILVPPLASALRQGTNSLDCLKELLALDLTQAVPQ